jgi:hypothetical protein
MHNTSTFTPNLLTAEQIVELQAVFDQVCGEHEFGPDDKEARDRIAERLMAVAIAGHATVQAISEARLTARNIVRERRGEVDSG